MRPSRAANRACNGGSGRADEHDRHRRRHRHRPVHGQRLPSVSPASVLLSYAIGALITPAADGLPGGNDRGPCHPGSFGAFAERYVGPLAGFLVLYAYWAAIVRPGGHRGLAVAMYMKYWFAGIPEWVWIISFSTLLIG